MSRKPKKRSKRNAANYYKPTDKEKINKVKEAIEALNDEDSSPILIDQRHNAAAMELTEAEDMWGVLAWVLVLLEEIQAIGPVECFAAKTAPRCDKKGFKNLFLFAYCWESDALEEKVYLKFAIKKNEGSNLTFCHLNLHKSNED